MFTKEHMDKMCEEAFAMDDIERIMDIGFDPMEVVKGNEEAKEAFKKQHEAAKSDR